MPASLQLALLIAILLPAGKIAAAICARFGVPTIMGELMVGVAAGPGLLNIMHWKIFSGTPATDAFMLLAQIGGFVLMFIAGLETDIERMHKAGPTAFMVALSGVILPFLLGAGAAHLLGMGWGPACFLGGALTATSVSISARTLMDAGRMASPEASVIMGAAVIDDVMGLFILAFLAASCSTGSAEAFGLAPALSECLKAHWPWAAGHALLTQMSLIAISVAVYFLIAYGVARRWSGSLMRLIHNMEASESVTACVLAMVMLYAISAEWLGSVAGITGAYLLGYVFAGAELKQYVEQAFAAIGHGLLIPLFFTSIGLASNFGALNGHWLLLAVTLAVAIVSKLFGCGSAALAMGMGPVRSFRIGCGMISRGEVGLIVTAMGASSGLFKDPEVAVMVSVVLLTTLLTPMIMRGAFMIHCPGEEPAAERPKAIVSATNPIHGEFSTEQNA